MSVGTFRGRNTPRGDFEEPRSQATTFVEFQAVVCRRRAGNVAASERSLRGRPCGARPLDVLCGLVANKS
jgi:hypothetical protein